MIPIPTALNKAADYIDRYGLYKHYYWLGWSRDTPFRWGTPCCSIGAIAAVLFPGSPAIGLSEVTVYIHHFSNYLVHTGLEPDGIVSLWTDEPDRTVTEVVDALRNAAEWVPEEVKCNGHGETKGDEPGAG